MTQRSGTVRRDPSIYASGIVVTGGKVTGDQGLLNHRRRMDETRAAADRETQAVQAEQQRLDDHRRDLASAEATDAGRREELTACERRLIELDLKTSHASEERERTGTQKSWEWFQWLAEQIDRHGVSRTNLQTGAFIAHRDWKP